MRIFIVMVLGVSRIGGAENILLEPDPDHTGEGKHGSLT
jgi:hypothetical protein